MVEATCAVAAVLFFVSNIMGFSFFNRYGGRGSYTWTDYRNLNTDLIQSEFEYRLDKYFFELSSGVMNAIAWMIFCIPLIQVAWIQSKRGTFLLGTHVTIAALAIGGSVTELISRLMFIGATATTNWIARGFNLDDWIDIENGEPEAVEDGANVTTTTQEGDMIGWRVLEMIHIVTRGLITWIDAAEWLFLATIMVLIYISVYKSEESAFSRNWARAGLLIGAMAFLHFTSDILHLRKWITHSPVALFLSAISRLIMIPIWLLWMGMQLSAVRLHPQAAVLSSEESSRRACQSATEPDTTHDTEVSVFS